MPRIGDAHRGPEASDGSSPIPGDQISDCRSRSPDPRRVRNRLNPAVLAHLMACEAQTMSLAVSAFPAARPASRVNPNAVLAVVPIGPVVGILGTNLVKAAAPAIRRELAVFVESARRGVNAYQ